MKSNVFTAVQAVNKETPGEAAAAAALPVQ